MWMKMVESSLHAYHSNDFFCTQPCMIRLYYCRILAHERRFFQLATSVCRLPLEAAFLFSRLAPSTQTSNLSLLDCKFSGAFKYTKFVSIGIIMYKSFQNYNRCSNSSFERHARHFNKRIDKTQQSTILCLAFHRRERRAKPVNTSV